MFVVCFLYVICQKYVFSMFLEMAGSKSMYFLYVFNMIGCHSIKFHWFPLTASLALHSVLVCNLLVSLHKLLKYYVASAERARAAASYVS